VHVPCRFDEDWEFNTVQVFTLGKASWRDVAITVPGSTCDLGAGIVDISGTTYWATVAGDISCHSTSRTSASNPPVLGY
jgi:hypothetical protein